MPPLVRASIKTTGRQQIDHRHSDDHRFFLMRDETGELQVTLQLRRVDDQDEDIRLHSRMFTFDDVTGQFLLGRRSDGAVDPRQIDDADHRTQTGSAPATQQRNGDARIICGSEIPAGDGVHQRGLAGIRHSHQTNGQFSNGGFRGGFLNGGHAVLTLINPDPRRLTFSQSQQCASNANHQRIPKRCVMRDHDLFAGGEAKIDQSRAVLIWAFEGLNAKPTVERNIREWADVGLGLIKSY
jgi:hypothetical protein